MCSGCLRVHCQALYCTLLCVLIGVETTILDLLLEDNWNIPEVTNTFNHDDNNYLFNLILKLLIASK